jgi:hypothetical protein
MTKVYTMKRLTADDACEALIEWVRCADIDQLAEMYSIRIASNDEAVLIDCEGEESNWFTNGTMMKMQLVPFDPLLHMK